MAVDKSKLEFVSVSVVLEDKLRGSDQVKVWAAEKLPFIQGKIADHAVKYDHSLPDASGVERKTVLSGDATIVAKWLGDGNRITSPDVRKNETVKLYTFADTGEYFWEDMFREPSLRRLETVCHAYSNLQEPLKPFSKESSYFTEVSTHDKHMVVQTSKSDGEKYVYTVKIDTGGGKVFVQDDVGNSFILDSNTNSVSLKGIDNVHAEDGNGNVVDLGKDGVLIESPTKIRLKAPVIEFEGDTKTTGSDTVTGDSIIEGTTLSAGPLVSSSAVIVNGITLQVP